jgi:hypothetical protein
MVLVSHTWSFRPHCGPGGLLSLQQNNELQPGVHENNVGGM